MPQRARGLGTTGGRLGVILWALFALGAWLAWVPDRLAFTVSQAAVVAHVALGVAALPALALLLWRHVRRPIAALSARPSRGVVALVAARGLTLAALLMTLATGAWVACAGAVSPAAPWHRAMGLALALPLALHAALDGRRALARGLALAIGSVAAATLALGCLTSRLRPPAPAPAFAWRQAASTAYDSATWCGECHGDIYREWRQSVHARTLEVPMVRADLAREGNRAKRQRDLLDVARAIETGERWEPPAAFDACRGCHTPTTFYARDRRPPLDATGVASEGITCSFCHTIRGTREFARRAPAFAGGIGRIAEGVVGDSDPLLAYFTSRPDLVARYFGQASGSRALRGLGNLLIRWRPAQHRADYRPPFMRRSEVCVGCHGGAGEYPESPFKTYFGWYDSDFRTASNTSCQDCHMSLEPGRRPPPVPGRRVDGGPVLPGRRVHLFLGGNAQVHRMLGNPDMVERERRFAAAAHSLDVREATLRGDRLALTAVVGARGVGHDYPAMETNARFAWVEARALDASGRELWRSPRGDIMAPAQATWDTPIFYREVDMRSVRVVRERLVHAGGESEVSWSWTLPAGASVATLEVSLWGRFSAGALVSVTLRRASDGRFVVAREPAPAPGR